VTEDGFGLLRLPPVRALARCSAAWQFNVVPDRCGITRQVLKVGREGMTHLPPTVVFARSADEPGLKSRWLLWTG
jgi:hypothetical protein